MSELTTALVTAIVATVLPSPTDPIHFYLQNWLYKHRMSRVLFEFWELFDWYVLDALWYAFLLLLVFMFKFDDVSGVATIVTIVGVGATVSILWRFLRKR